MQRKKLVFFICISERQKLRRSSSCSLQGSRRPLPLFFPPAAIIGSGRCQYRPRPLPTEKARTVSRSGMAWFPFVAAFFLSSQHDLPFPLYILLFTLYIYPPAPLTITILHFFLKIFSVFFGDSEKISNFAPKCLPMSGPGCLTTLWIKTNLPVVRPGLGRTFSLRYCLCAVKLRNFESRCDGNATE